MVMVIETISIDRATNRRKVRANCKISLEAWKKKTIAPPLWSTRHDGNEEDVIDMATNRRPVGANKNKNKNSNYSNKAKSSKGRKKTVQEQEQEEARQREMHMIIDIYDCLK